MSWVRSGPDRRAVRAALPLVTVLTVLVLTYAAVSALVAGSSGPPLDPGSARPDGTMALAEILRDRGVDVKPTDDPPVAARATVVLAHPERVSPRTLAAFAAAVERGSDLVVLEAGGDVIEALDEALDIAVEHAGPVRSATPQAGCPLPEAEIAGAATLGGGSGFTVVSPPAAVTACYPVLSTPTLVVVERSARTPSGGRPGRLVLLGNAAFMTNDRLAQEGNAALAIGLLGRHELLHWVIPRPGDPDALAEHDLVDLLPDRVVSGCLQLSLAVVVLALWRGRRLGPVVPEPLPVVVRSAETVEGRGRLYAAAQARDLAAAALRAGLRARLADRLGMACVTGPGSTAAPYAQSPTPDSAGSPRYPEPEPEALVMSIAARTGRSPVEISELLYGSGMNHLSDGQLVVLADRLDALERQMAAV